MRTKDIDDALIEYIGTSHAMHRVGNSTLVNADCFKWLATAPGGSIHAIVTDPPYGVKEFDDDQMEKRSNGRGGIWRLPPSFGGHTRAPVPRFTALNKKERQRIKEFFTEWSRLCAKSLRPGGHLFIASNTFLSQLVFESLVDGGLEFRGEVIRLVQTLRGGDRPKNAEEEFPDVCSLPRGCYEPWGIFRRPLPDKMTVAECLRQYGTGGLRRSATGKQFCDVIESNRTSREERNLANHPSLKPIPFLRQIVHAALPLGKGVIVDPFMGSGSTIAAAELCGLQAVGIEKSKPFYEMSVKAVPALLRLYHRPQLQLI
jgi:site-specific DNA-methyltransferase (adenine-specific)